MENEINTLQAQIDILTKKLSDTPEKIGIKYNPQFFALKGKINNLRIKMQALKNYQHLAQ